MYMIMMMLVSVCVRQYGEGYAVDSDTKGNPYI